MEQATPGFRATFQVILSAYDLKLGVPVISEEDFNKLVGE